jgi:hypothetical protein
VSELFELFVLLNVNVELSQSVENKLSLIDENIDLILQKLLAIFFHFLRHRSTEHHNLLVMWGLDKDLLNISSHSRVAQNLVTFVNHEEFALNKILYIPYQT